MGWAETRIEQYKQGQKATWIERRILEHANPVHLVLQVLGAIPLIHGLWAHNWGFILLGLFINFMGHIYCSLKK